jgi:hypothetical protein
MRLAPRRVHGVHGGVGRCGRCSPANLAEAAERQYQRRHSRSAGGRPESESPPDGPDPVAAAPAIAESTLLFYAGALLAAGRRALCGTQPNSILGLILLSTRLT